MKKLFFNENKIAGYVVKPFTLDKVEQLSPIMEKVVYNFMSSKITFDTIEENLPKILSILTAEYKSILSIVLDEKEEVILKLNMETVNLLMIALVKVNLGYLKNLYGPLSLILEIIQKKV